MKLKIAYRLARVFIHLAVGMAYCGALFPWLGRPRRDRIVQRWSRQLLAICGVAFEKSPGAPALAHAMIVANHVSWLDIFVINAMHPCRFVAKSEIRQWPMLGWLAEKAGTVFIARGQRRDLRHIFKGLVASLQQGERVAFFPEGTTAPQGALMPFHANFYEAAVDAAVMVQPYALRYVDAAGVLHPAIEFLGDMTFADSMLTILACDSVRAQLICLAPVDAKGAHRRELAASTQAAIGAALGNEIETVCRT